MGTASGATEPEHPSQRRAGVRRAAAAVWLVVIGVVVEQGGQGLFSGQPPAFLIWLGSVVSLQGDQPLWLKLLSLLAVVIVVAALGWLTYLAWLANQGDDNSQAQPMMQGDSDLSGKVEAGVATIGTGAHITATYNAPVYHAPVYQGISPPAQETPPTVSAPSGLPRAVAFVGRAETLADLLAALRQGSAEGGFALADMGGVGCRRGAPNQRMSLMCARLSSSVIRKSF